MIAESGFLIARMTFSFIECSVTAFQQFDVAVVNVENFVLRDINM
jgi:hypothetical protein